MIGENKGRSLLGPARFEGLEEQGVPRASNFVPFGTYVYHSVHWTQTTPDWYTDSIFEEIGWGCHQGGRVFPRGEGHDYFQISYGNQSCKISEVFSPSPSLLPTFLGAHYILGFDWSSASQGLLCHPSKDLDFIPSRPCVFSQVGSGPASIPRDT